MKRLLIWLGLVKPVPTRRPRMMREAWPSLYFVLLRFRPDLIAELEPFGVFPLGRLGAWLDQHFPLKAESWAKRPFTGLPDQLRDYLENASVR
jgi:hypothetical protein